MFFSRGKDEVGAREFLCPKKQNVPVELTPFRRKKLSTTPSKRAGTKDTHQTKPYEEIRRIS